MVNQHIPYHHPAVFGQEPQGPGLAKTYTPVATYSATGEGQGLTNVQLALFGMVGLASAYLLFWDKPRRRGRR